MSDKIEQPLPLDTPGHELKTTEVPARQAHASRLRFQGGRRSIQLPPQSRYRRRADGGTDETFRVNFIDRLDAVDMRRVAELLFAVAEEGKDAGIVALTKLEFIEPDTCEYRYWCADLNKDRVKVMFGLWHRMHQLHAISTIDGVPYTPSDRDISKADSSQDIPRR